MVKKQEILEMIKAISYGRLSPWDFYARIEESSWNMHQYADAETMALVGDIKLIFEDYYHGALDEPHLIERLASIVNPTEVIEVAPIQLKVHVTFTPVRRTSLAPLLMPQPWPELQTV